MLMKRKRLFENTNCHTQSLSKNTNLFISVSGIKYTNYLSFILNLEMLTFKRKFLISHLLHVRSRDLEEDEQR